MVGRWMVCAFAVAACTGESGGNRMMIDAPVGTGGMAGGAGSAGAIGGTGGDLGGCATTCSAPASTTFCITGTVRSFVDPSMLALPTAQSNIVVKIYDPIAFVTNPNTPPVTTVNVEQLGCFIADDIPRFSNGMVAVVTDDADGTGDAYVPMGASAILHAGQNVTGEQAYYLENTTVATWQSEIGPGNPPGCSAGLLGCGMYLGEYVDASGCPIANLQPIRPGDNPPPGNVFCFGPDRLTLTTNDVTSAVGICAISPDVVEPHTGACASGGCTCCGNSCNPSFQSAAVGGSAPGIIFFQQFVASP